MTGAASVFWLLGIVGQLFQPEPLPVCVVERDDTRITRSCRVAIAESVTLVDRGAPGVIQIAASDIVVDFEGAELRGSPETTSPSAYAGYGIRIEGQTGVTLRGARVRGFLAGIWATDADGLTLEDCDVSDNRRQRLRSSPWVEDPGDWLRPHDNDRNEWLARYGAGIYVEDSSELVVRRCRAREVQNGLVLDRVERSRIYDNDFSFLSGWGIALWRSSRNVISRNATDFCIRGYSHGVYNRGQDSAGILAFEQCNENVIAENSATHGGDGFFGFAGREALAETGSHEAEWYQRRGNNDNLLLDNDFSYAAAHGIEMTFSFGNRFIGNRLEGNAICGVWAGYSQDTLIAGNSFSDNGDAGYGLERGGVNIEHGRGNRIVHNVFHDNRVGVHLWWDPEGDFASKPWGRANGTASTENLIAANGFDGDDLLLHLHGPATATLGPNRQRAVEQEVRVEDDAVLERSEAAPVKPPRPRVELFGESRPVGARRELAGRHRIVMTEWGPWDHVSPLARRVEKSERAHVYELRKMPADLQIAVEGAGIRGRFLPTEPGMPQRYQVHSESPDGGTYRLRLAARGYRAEVEDRLGVEVATHE